MATMAKIISMAMMTTMARATTTTRRMKTTRMEIITRMRMMVMFLFWFHAFVDCHLIAKQTGGSLNAIGRCTESMKVDGLQSLLYRVQIDYIYAYMNTSPSPLRF